MPDTSSWNDLIERHEQGETMDSSASRQIRTSYFTGFNSVRIALGLVLLIAAGLKGYEFATEPAVRVGLFESRWFLIGLIELEFSFGVWLLLGF